MREIAWAHNIAIMEKCKDPLEREFYIRMTKKFGWTKNVLIHQIENQSYEKTLLNKTNFNKTIPEKYRHQAKLAVKDEYTFDFLELGEDHSERELERAILSKIDRCRDILSPQDFAERIEEGLAFSGTDSGVGGGDRIINCAI